VILTWEYYHKSNGTSHFVEIHEYSSVRFRGLRADEPREGEPDMEAVGRLHEPLS
jgi:hypothetical protein